MKVGLPRAMHFYSYGILWYTFLEKLGAQVILSDLSNREILDSGAKKMVDGACLPIKILRGHVENLKEKGADYIFLPRVVKLTNRTFACPKSAGLPELIFQTGRDLPPLLSPVIEGSLTDPAPYYETAKKLGAGKKTVQKAFALALRKWSLQQKEKQIQKQGQKTIGILGHSYLTEDAFLNFHLIEKLQARGYNTFTSKRQHQLPEHDGVYPQFMFWQSGHDMAYVMQENTEDIPRADGYIFLSAFGCGPDSYIESYCRDFLQKKGFPYLALTLDEQTGEAGFETRVEAFLDMIERKERRAGA